MNDRKNEQEKETDGCGEEVLELVSDAVGHLALLCWH